MNAQTHRTGHRIQKVPTTANLSTLLRNSTTGLQHLLLICFASPLDKDRFYTLQGCLFPERFEYTLQVAGNELVLVPRDASPGGRPVGVLLPPPKPLDKSALPVYLLKDIHVPLNDDAVALLLNPRKTFMKGKDVCFFKQILAGDVSMTVTELTTYTKINAAKLGEDVCVSRFPVVVEDEQTSRIVGLLLLYIDCKNVTLLCGTGWQARVKGKLAGADNTLPQGASTHDKLFGKMQSMITFSSMCMMTHI